MAARARVEWVNVGLAGQHAIVASVVSALAPIAVSTTATTAGSRPTAPAGCQHARVTALDNPIVVAWGANPTATEVVANSVRLEAGQVELVPVSEGHKLSFLEVT